MTSRVPLQSRETQPGQEDLWDMLERERAVPTSNVFRAMANCPEILKAFIPMADAVRKGSGIDPKLRELAIVMACQTMGTHYERDRHWNMALRAGVTKEKLERLWDFDKSDVFSDDERAVLRLAKYATQAPAQVPDEVWDGVHERLGTSQSVALLFSIGWYNMTGRLTGPLQLEDEPHFKRN